MNVQQQITKYLDSLPGPKRLDMQTLHQRILGSQPTCKLWYLDGKDETGKIVSNPNIGYGQQILKYADGKTREFYQIGISANKTGISLYILGIEDKTYLTKTYGEKLGKASITGYCIKFKALGDIDMDVLEEVIQFGLEARQ